MRVFEIEILGEKVRVYCDCKNRKDGFKHVATVYFNKCKYECKIKYINRTYEFYDYQRVLYKIVYCIRDSFIDRKINYWKKENNKKRISKNVKERICKEVDNLFSFTFNGLAYQPKVVNFC